MKSRLLLIAVVVCCLACKDKTPLNQSTEEVNMMFYKPDFKLSTLSGLRVDGYYEVKKVTSNSDMENNALYGFIHFMDDGFCRISLWNGIQKNSMEVKSAFESSKGVFYGIYEIKNDSLNIEYLYSPASPGYGKIEERHIINAVISEEKILIIKDRSNTYSYNSDSEGSSLESCIGTFVQAEYDSTLVKNYLKDNINKYTTSK